MHVSHAFHVHEPGTDARIWAAHIGAAHICNIVWCICLSNMGALRVPAEVGGVCGVVRVSPPVYCS